MALKPGATIAFVSPSMRANEHWAKAISRATALLTSRGYVVREIFNKDTDIQSSIANRLAELRSAFLDPSISGIICTIGGGTFNELLPALIADKELQASIRADPKIVVGMSDNTGLHWFLHACTGLRAFYGPSAIPELGTADPPEDQASPLAFCVKYLFEVIAKAESLGQVLRSPTYAPGAPAFFRDPQSTAVQKVVPAPEWKWLRPGKAQGRLFGGCLPMVASLNGVAAVAPDWRGAIVFFETHSGDAGDLLSVRASIATLIAQGTFEEAAGLVVGRAVGYDTEEDRDKYADLITQLLCQGRLGNADNQFPILFNVDIGHTTPMVTLPYGALAELDSESNRFAILEAGVV